MTSSEYSPIKLCGTLPRTASDVEEGQCVQTPLVDTPSHVGALVAGVRRVSVGQRRMVQEEALQGYALRRSYAKGGAAKGEEKGVGE